MSHVCPGVGGNPRLYSLAFHLGDGFPELNADRRVIPAHPARGTASLIDVRAKSFAYPGVFPVEFAEAAASIYFFGNLRQLCSSIGRTPESNRYCGRPFKSVTVAV